MSGAGEFLFRTFLVGKASKLCSSKLSFQASQQWVKHGSFAHYFRPFQLVRGVKMLT